MRCFARHTAALVLLVGCSFSKGTKKDLTTGLSTSYNGFAIDDIAIVGDGDKALSSGTVPMNSKFAIVFQGIENYTLKNDKAFPGLAITVTDSKGTEIMKEADLLAGSAEGYSSTDASVLRGAITVASPMVVGQSYHCTIRVFDKNNPTSEIVSELDFTVK
jgi:hypothetical protein